MIVLPMAGDSRRFKEAGYSDPKFMLPLKGRTVFRRVIDGFAEYFDSEEFLFITKKSHPQAEDFIAAECELAGLRNMQIVNLEKDTGGQAETVYLGLQTAQVDLGNSVTIFNIDTFRLRFSRPPAQQLKLLDGYLEVFRGDGENWSYVRPKGSKTRQVSEVREKMPISDLCSTGLYHFGCARDFIWAYENPRDPENEAEKKEAYVAPLYNALIEAGRKIEYHLVDRNDVVFCGTADEYKDLLGDSDFV